MDLFLAEEIKLGIEEGVNIGISYGSLISIIYYFVNYIKHFSIT